MKGIGVLQEGIHAPLDLGPITDPEDRIQRKEAVLKENFCEHVQKLHQDKNAPFGKEYQVQYYVYHIKTDRNAYIPTLIGACGYVRTHICICPRSQYIKANFTEKWTLV